MNFCMLVTFFGKAGGVFLIQVFILLFYFRFFIPSIPRFLFVYMPIFSSFFLYFFTSLLFFLWVGMM